MIKSEISISLEIVLNFSICFTSFSTKTLTLALALVSLFQFWCPLTTSSLADSKMYIPASNFIKNTEEVLWHYIALCPGNK